MFTILVLQLTALFFGALYQGKIRRVFSFCWTNKTF